MADSVAQKPPRSEREALAAFLAAHQERLLAHIELRLGKALRRKVEPRDILQEVSIQVLDMLPSTQLGERDPFPWLCHLAEQRIIDVHRKFFGTHKRAAGREIPLENPDGSTSQGDLIDQLAASITSP